jgi:hypothetical protein
MRTVDALVEIHTELTFFGDRLTKDVMGAFVPLRALKKSPEPQDEKKVGESKQAGQPKTQKDEALQDIFIVKDMNVSGGAASGTPLFTFITSNPLIVYDEITPRCVRVVYALTRQKAEASLWQLARFESPHLDLKKFQENRSKGTVRGYPLLDNIRMLSMECIALKREEKDAKKELERKQQKAEKPKRKEFERFEVWDDQKQLKENKNMMPDFIELKGTLVDARKKREVPFSFLVPIMAHTPLVQPTERMGHEQHDKQAALKDAQAHISQALSALQKQLKE